MELFKQFNDNPAFKKWLADMVFSVTYSPDGQSETLKPELLKAAEESVEYKAPSKQ
jgi:hypothetical protein